MQLSPEGESSPTTERRQLCEQFGVDQTVTTAQAAVLLGLKDQSLWRWACYGCGPIKPRRMGRFLRWSVADIQAVLNSTAHASTPTSASPRAP